MQTCYRSLLCHSIQATGPIRPGWKFQKLILFAFSWWSYIEKLKFHPQQREWELHQVKPDFSHTAALTLTLVQHVLQQNLQLKSRKARSRDPGVKRCQKRLDLLWGISNMYKSLQPLQLSFIHTHNFNWNGPWPQQGLFHRGKLIVSK